MVIRSAHPGTRRRGVALLVALIALVVLDATVALLWVGAQQQMRVGRQAIELTRVSLAADGELAGAYSAWDTVAFDVLAVGGSVSRPSASWDRGVTASATIERLSPSLFEIRSRAEIRDGLGEVRSQRTVALLVRRRRDSGSVAPISVVRSHAWRVLE